MRFSQPLDRGMSSSGSACCEAMETESKEAKEEKKDSEAISYKLWPT